MFVLLAMLAFNSPQLSAVEEVKPAVQERILPWQGHHEFFADFAYTNIPTTGAVSVSKSAGVEFNCGYPWNWRMLGGGCWIEVKVTANAEEAQKKWNLGLSHLSSLISPRNMSRSPIDIEVNGVTIASHFLPPIDAWREDNFALNLNEGENTIVIRLLDDCTSHYWIQKLYLDPIK